MQYRSALSIFSSVTLFAALAVPLTAQAGEGVDRSFGHSSHGPAFDEGPRQAPWRMTGIGRAPCAITTQVPEVQEWFDQANALLHSFWHYEAERSLRWCIRLDPDCAMAYLWLARVLSDDKERSAEFLKQAVARKHLVTERERRYIEAWEDHFVPSLEVESKARFGWRGKSKALGEEFEKIVIDYPDDVEAKLIYAFNVMYESGRYAVDAVLRQVLEVYPDHPGAHHYLIHNWDEMELAHHVLDSSEAYGRIAPMVGHANHMPGHIYTKLGMWHEAAIWLDAATRVEKDYMQRQLVLPFHAWNYSHNRNFLAHAQAMLGMPTAALQGARDLVNAPLDPDRNKPEGGYAPFGQGIGAMWRTLVRFERWDAILTDGVIPWRDIGRDKLWRAYSEARAHLGKGDAAAAEQKLLALRELDEEKGVSKRSLQVAIAEIEAHLWLERGELTKGLARMTEAAEREFDWRPRDNDPPTFPRCLYNVLGEAYLDLDSPRLAVSAFEKALEVLPNNGWSWAGLARAHVAMGDRDAARDAYAKMLHVWSSAEPGIRQADAAHALGLGADGAVEPHDPSPRPQRNYGATTLSDLGPNTWQPYAAPALAVHDVAGEAVSLDRYRGKHVLLVFFLSDQCVHCVEQLQALSRKQTQLAERDTVVLAVSAKAPDNSAAESLADLGITLLFDGADHANAIRFKSYDEFEDLELHSTHLIDRQGRLRWVRAGGEPFMDVDFLLQEIDRIESIEAQKRLEAVGAVEASSGAASSR